MNRHARGRIRRTVLPKVQSVCDVGCGSGETAIELARRGLEVHAVDSSPVFCEAVRKSARRAKLTVAVHCDDRRDFRLLRPVAHTGGTHVAPRARDDLARLLD